MNAQFVLPYAAGAIKLTAKQAAQLFTADEIAAGQKRGEMETRGHWQIPTAYPPPRQ